MLFNILKKCNTKHSIMTMRSLFVRNARSLEKLKNETVGPQIYERGKYLVCLKDTDFVLVDPKARKVTWVNEEDLLPYNTDNSLLRILLDVVDQEPEPCCLFAVDVPLGASNVDELGKTLGGKFFEARKALFLLDDSESALVSQARGLVNFCRKTNFCPNCGSVLTTNSAGTQKTCNGCKKTHYPTLSPVGIVLIEDEAHSKVLLVRGLRHPPGMYSCVAGFIEPGESLEGNIRREIAEEVGVDVKNIEYCASQHWAMPDSQLMLGCIATATSEDFEVDPVELQGGQWVTSETLKDALDRAKLPTASAMDPNVLWVPPPAAVAHTLMEAWLKKHHGYIPPVTSRI